MKKNEDDIIGFFEKEIRSFQEEEGGKRYFSVVDVVSRLAGPTDPAGMWRRMKKKLSDRGYLQAGNYRRAKLTSRDGRMRFTETADLETVLNLIQLLPGPRADRFRQWLAKAGQERFREIKDPEKGIDRALDAWRNMGRDEKWILRRLMTQETRHRLTEYWASHGITEGEEFRSLTNTLHEMWSGMTVAEHKQLKGLRSQNLRDHMNEAELIFTSLAEMAVRQIAESRNATGLRQNAFCAGKGGNIARTAREQLEKQTGKNVLSKENFLPPPRKRKEPR